MRVWPRLRGWLDDDVDGQRLFRHLAGAADAWDAMGRPDSELYRGARLARTVEWRDRADPDLNDVEAAFLDASVALAESEVRAAETRVAHERRVNRRLRGALAGVGVLLILTLVAGLVAVRSADRAGRERDVAAGERDRRRAGRQTSRTPVAPAPRGCCTRTSRPACSSPSRASRPTSPPRPGRTSGRRSPERARCPACATSGELLGRSGTAWMPSVSASADGDAGRRQSSWATASALRRRDAGTPAVPGRSPHRAISVALSPDGSQLAVAATGDDDQPLRLYDLPSGTLSQNQPGGIPASSGLNVRRPVRRGSGLQPRRQPAGRGAAAVRSRRRSGPRFGAHHGLGPGRPRPSRCSRSGCRRSPSPR